MILTPDQRLRIFVSSTLVELAAERAVIRDVIESMRLAPVMFELGARPHPPRALYRAYLEQSHVFVAVYGDKYGWVAPSMDISGLEDEFRLSGDRPKLAYVRDPAPERDARLTEMLEDVAADPKVTLRLYSTPDELSSMLADDLAHLLAEAFAPAPPGAGAPTVAGPIRTALPAASVLPMPPTPLVGRVAEVEEVTGLLRRYDVRLVTVTGIGGIGKSRLALEAARRCGDDFPGGVVQVALSEVPEAGLVLTSIASELGIHLDSTRPSLDTVAEALAERGEILLWLDNAEHVEDAASDLAALIATCPGLTLLVTSRKRLKLAAEHDYPLPPLGLGPAQDEHGFGGSPDQAHGPVAVSDDSCAMQLFRERAHAARPDLDLVNDEDERRAALELCRRLDGIPLAIELAAARVRLLPPTRLLERFERPLDLASARLADLPQRQRTLRATLNWSRELLSPAEQSLLAQLSTFIGGASLDAVERVCTIDGDVLESLATLVDHSLLDVELTAVDAPRFRMLSTVREYARDLLDATGRAVEVDLAHRAWVRDLADRAHAGLPGPDHAEWIERLEMEAGNIRTAGSRAYAEGDPQTLAEVGFELWLWLWSRHHTREARLWLERALDPPDRMEPATHARLLWAIAGAAVEQGDNEVARTRLAEAEALFDEHQDEEGQALALFLRASLAPLDGDNEAAIELFEKCEKAHEAMGNVFLASVCASIGGMILSQEGRFDEAEVRLDRGLRLGESIANDMLLGQAQVARGFARLGRGSLDDAWDDLRCGARYARDCSNPEVLSFACDGLAAVLLMRGQVDENAAAFIGAAQGLRERAGIVPWPVLRPVMAAIADGVRDGQPAETFEKGWNRGRRLDLDGVLALTRESGVLVVPDEGMNVRPGP
jgi:predicted ATPase